MVGVVEKDGWADPRVPGVVGSGMRSETGHETQLPTVPHLLLSQPPTFPDLQMMARSARSPRLCPPTPDHVLRQRNMMACASIEPRTGIHIHGSSALVAGRDGLNSDSIGIAAHRVF